MLSLSILGFQLLQIAMVEMGVLPKLSNYIIRELTWRKELLTLRQLTEKMNADVKIICIVRDEKVMEPALDLFLQQQDRLIVLGSPESISQLEI